MGILTPILIKTGLNSGQYVEVLSGLQEGSQVVVSQTGGTTSTTTTTRTGTGGGGFGGGGFGGGGFGGGGGRWRWTWNWWYRFWRLIMMSHDEQANDEIVANTHADEQVIDETIVVAHPDERAGK